MRKELKIIDSRTDKLLGLVVYEDGKIKVLGGEENYKQALALEIDRDFERDIFINGKFQRLFAKKHTPEFLDVLAEFEEYNYGCRTELNLGRAQDIKQEREAVFDIELNQDETGENFPEYSIISPHPVIQPVVIKC